MKLTLGAMDPAAKVSLGDLEGDPVPATSGPTRRVRKPGPCEAVNGGFSAPRLKPSQALPGQKHSSTSVSIKGGQCDF
jgi:hypothetical protein